jgi:hypothetical protein
VLQANGTWAVLQKTVQIFSTPGTFTYTPTPGTLSIVVECWGAGGGGGSVNSPSSGTGSPSPRGVAGGGASGAYARSTLSPSVFAPSTTLTVGAGGAGATLDNQFGGTGGDTFFGGATTAAAWCWAFGGFGGGGWLQSGVGGRVGTVGGYATDIKLAGFPGGAGIIGNDGTAGWVTMGGQGGGPGGGATTVVTGPGYDAEGISGGGGGATVGGAGSGPFNGGKGGNGCIVVTEYSFEMTVPNSASQTQFGTPP